MRVLVRPFFGLLLVAALSLRASGTPAAQGSTSAFFPSFEGRSGEVLTAQNWSAAVDYFVVQNNPGPQAMAPIIVGNFSNPPVESWTTVETRWLAFPESTSVQLTPVPEPSTYGAILLGSAAALVAYRRRRAAKQSAA